MGALLLSASAAMADPFTVTTGQSITISGQKDDPGNPSYPYQSYNIVQQGDPSGHTSGQINGSSVVGISQNYQTYAYEDPSVGEIIFGNNASTIGALSSVKTNTTVNVTFTNEGNSTFAPKLTSTITPAGFGMAVVNPQLGAGFGAVNGGVGNLNQIPLASNLTFDSTNGYGLVRGIASVQFDILQNDPSGGPAHLLVSYFKSLTLDSPSQYNFDADGNYLGATILPTTMTLAESGFVAGDAIAPGLNNFGLATPASSLPVGSQQAVGYQWDATDVTVSLGAIDPGMSTTLTYSTTVTAYSAWQWTTERALLVYAGFGDPIGKQGSITGGATALEALLGDVSVAGGASDPLSLGLSFSNYHFSLPNVGVDSNGDPVIDSLGQPIGQSAALDPVIVDVNIPAPPSAAPEPSIWALMMLAVGGMGVALRSARRRRVV